MPEYLTLEKIKWPSHGAGESNDYAIDWSAFTVPGDTVVSATYTLPAGITEGAKSYVGLVSHVVLSGGVAGQLYEIPVRALTAQARDLRVTMLLPVITRKG